MILVVTAGVIGSRFVGQSDTAPPDLAESMTSTANSDPLQGASPAPTPSASSTTPAANESPVPAEPSPPEPEPTPAAVEPAPGTAALALEALVVGPAGSSTPYDRDLFGWRSVDHDRNGCDIRNDVLRRDLTQLVIREGTNGCRVDAGVLDDPYTGTQIGFVVGGGASSDGGVQIDHVVALANAWASGADAWSSETLLQFGNDPLNLLAVDGSANQSKSDGDAAEWLPDNVPFHCPFVARQIAVKQLYELRITPSEAEAMSQVLMTCPSEPLPTVATTSTP